MEGSVVKSELHRLKSERGQLDARRREIEKRIDEIDTQILAIQWANYPIGSRVVHNGHEYEVAGYGPWVTGFPVKKDGSLSKVCLTLYGLQP